MSPSSTIPRVLFARFLIGGLILGVAAGCASSSGARGGGSSKGGQPDWVGGESKKYSQGRYMTGVGQGDTRQVAKDSALAEISRIFKTEIDQVVEDFQRSTTVSDSAGGSRNIEVSDIQQLTKSSTAMVLEGARIAENWVDPKTGEAYALAVLERDAASTNLQSKIKAADAEVGKGLKAADAAGAPLEKLRALKGALDQLQTRGVLNGELKIVSKSAGLPSSVSAGDVAGRIAEVLEKELPVSLSVQGEGADVVRGAAVEALAGQGFVVAPGDGGAITVRGTVKVAPADMDDPKWKYVRWEADFEVATADGTVIGHVQEKGREGHVSESEAHSKALRTVRKKVAAQVGGKLASYVFGKSEGD